MEQKWAHVELTDKEAAVIMKAQLNGGIAGVVPSISPETYEILEHLRTKGVFIVTQEHTVPSGTKLWPSGKVVQEDAVGIMYALVPSIELFRSEEH